MKRLLQTLAFFLLTITTARSQNSTTGYGEGNTTMSFGYGYGHMEMLFEGIVQPHQHFGPVYAKLEHAMTDVVGLALNVGYSEFRRETSGGVNYNAPITIKDVATFSALFRVNIHLTPHRRADLYIGSGLGYRSINRYSQVPNYYFDYNYNALAFELEEDNKSSSTVGWEGTLGLNYYVSNAIALYGEAGLAKSILQGGMTFRF